MDFGGEDLHSAHVRGNRCYIGAGHAAFAGNVDFGGAGLHTARARGEAVRVCTQRARAAKRQGSAQHVRAVKQVLGPIHDILARLPETNRPEADPFEKWRLQVSAGRKFRPTQQDGR